MWLFSRGSTPKASKPVQRQISIRTRDETGEIPPGDEGQTYESVFQSMHNHPQTSRSSFLNNLGSSQTGGELTFTEEDGSETTTSSGRSSRRQLAAQASRNNSYLREPLDARLLSNVSSPGFTTRIVQQANGSAGGSISPLREIIGNRSPFSRSPNGHLKVGQLPISAVPRRPASALSSFPTPRGRSYATCGRFSRIAKRDGKNGTVFVKIAPVDAKGAGPPVTPSSPNSSGMSLSPQGAMSMSPYNEPISPGLGGIPQAGLTHRFSRLWPNPNGPPNSMPPGYPGSFSSSGPGNLAEVMANRKRGREAELGSESSNKVIRQLSTPSTPLSSPDEMVKYPKRVKFVNDQEMRLNRPLAFDSYHEPIPNGGQPMTSILEQMNQTEKRFLPDATVTSMAKKSRMMGSPSPRGASTSTPISALRKRRGLNGFSMVEDEEEEDPKSKTVKFCHCNECYQEAAGLKSPASPVKSPVESPIVTPKKTVSFVDEVGSARKASVAQREAERQKLDRRDDDIMDNDESASKPEIIIRKANRSSAFITMDKYEADRIRRLERFRRILGLQKEEPKAMDDVDGSKLTGVSTSATLQPITTVSFSSPTPISFPSKSNTSDGFNIASGSGLVDKGNSGDGSAQITSQQKLAEPEKDTVPKPSLSFGFGLPSPAVTTAADSIKTESSSAESLAVKSESVNPPTTSSTNPISITFGAPKDGSNSGTGGGFSFGQPVQPAQAETAPKSGGFSFGQTSTTPVTGDSSKDQSPIKSTFGIPTPTTTTASFGTPSTTQQTTLFGTSGSTNQPSLFGASSLTNQTSSPFGAPTTTSQTASPFASATTTSQAASSLEPAKESVPKPTPSFGFGSAAPAVTTAANFTKTESCSTGSFTFKSESANPSTTSSTNPISITFGTPKDGSTSNAGGGFSFSQPTQPAQAVVAPQSGGFSFGQSSTPADSSKDQNQIPSTTFGIPTTTSSFGTPSTTQQSSLFGSVGSGNQSSPFGASSLTNQASSPFGTSATTSQAASPFGAPTTTTSSFGASAPTTNQAASTFGSSNQTSLFGSSTATNQTSSPFGASSGTPQVNGFGSMGQNTSSSTPAFGTNNFTVGSSTASNGNSFSFGNSSNNSGGFAFGQPQTQTAANPQPGVFNFGQAPQSTTDSSKDQNQIKSAFGATTTASPFGAPPTTQPSSLFGSLGSGNQSSPFGASSLTNQTSSPFGNSTSTNQASSPFGASSTTTNQAASPFGASGTTTNQAASPFGSSNQTSLFGSSTATNQASSPFGASSGTPQVNGFGSMGQNTSSSTPAFGTNNFTVGSAAASNGNSFSFGNSSNNSGGFAFGQQQTQTAATPQPGVFNFGQTTAPQSAPGGFNFSAQAQIQPPPAYGANLPGAPGMFNLGTPVAAAPRSRAARLRKYR